MITLQNAFYKFCFCLGLGTASYYSYAQVQTWVKGDDTAASAVTQSILQDKLHDLAQDPSLTAEQRQARINQLMQAQANSFVQNPMSAVALSAVKPLIVAAPGAETPAADAVVAADASPSPSPGEGEKKKEGEEGKTAENAEGAAGPDATANGGIPMAQPLYDAHGNPFYPQAVPAQQPAQTQAQAETPAAAPNANGGLNPNQQASAGFNSPVASATATPSNSNSGYNGNNNSNTGIVTTPTSVLSSADLAALTSPVQAAFEDQQNKVNGVVCADTVRASCNRQTDVSVHSLRWGTEEGLEKNVNFAVKAASGANPVQFDVSFKIQDRLLNDQVVTLSAKPSEVLVHSESRDSKNYKVYEFKMPDTTVRNEDALTQVQATLVYEVTAAGMVMTSDSKFTFARDQVTTNGSTWDPTSGADRTPAQNELYFIADEIPYSMSLQKSP